MGLESAKLEAKNEKLWSRFAAIKSSRKRHQSFSLFTLRFSLDQ